MISEAIAYPNKVILIHVAYHVYNVGLERLFGTVQPLMCFPLDAALNVVVRAFKLEKLEGHTLVLISIPKSCGQCGRKNCPA